MHKAFPPRSLQLIETVSGKAQTLFSLAHSAVLLWKDNIDPQSIDREKWKPYLEIRPFLTWKPSIVVYDIGANIGAFANLAAWAPNVTAVYSFEPLSSMFMKLDPINPDNAPAPIANSHV
jgi:hypothetical protein